MSSIGNVDPGRLWKAGRARRLRRRLLLVAGSCAVVGLGAGVYAAAQPQGRTSLSVVTGPTGTPAPTQSTQPPLFAIVTTGRDDIARRVTFLLHHARLSGAVRRVEVKDESGSWDVMPNSCVEKPDGDLHFNHTYPRDGRYHLTLTIRYGSCDAAEADWLVASISTDTPVGPIDAGPA